MGADKLGKKLKTSRNKIRRKAKLGAQLEKARESREILVSKLRIHNIRIAKHLNFSLTKMKVALAEIRQFPQSKPRILILSWKKFLEEPKSLRIAKDVLGIEKFKEMYLQYVGERYKEGKG